MDKRTLILFLGLLVLLTGLIFRSWLLTQEPAGEVIYEKFLDRLLVTAILLPFSFTSAVLAAMELHGE